MVIGLDTAAETGSTRLLNDVAGALGEREAYIGRNLAETMGVRVGDEVAVVGQGVDGSLANDLFTIKALVTTSVDLMNRQAILIELPVAQTLFAMPDEAHEIVVQGRDADEAAALAAHLAALPALAGTEVLDWQRLAPELVSIVELTDIAGLLVLGLVLLAAAAGVANTMLMATFERTREFGMLLALGTRPARIVRLVLAESIALGLTGALLGSALGIALVAITHRTGIDYAWLTGGGPSELSFAGLRWSLLFYPTLAVSDVVRAVAAVCATSVLASAWPAVRASRLAPISAMRGL
jgi:ABC-type lipoprotein release transport system permease subunit